MRRRASILMLCDGLRADGRQPHLRGGMSGHERDRTITRQSPGHGDDHGRVWLPPLSCYSSDTPSRPSAGRTIPTIAQRPLTSEGIARFKRVVEGLKALEVKLELVLTSPLVRAHHTAELLVAGIGGKPRLDTLDAL